MMVPGSGVSGFGAYTPDSQRAVRHTGDAAREPWRGHLAPLDGLRGLAILLVLLLHFTTDMELPAGSVAAGVRSVFQLGWIGVDLFFVLSGFLITGILVDNKGNGRYFSAFYARRALRILPIYLLAVFAAFHILPRFFQDFDTGGARTEAAFWLFLTNFRELPYQLARTVGHFWSLAIEEQFYLMWPLVVFLSSRAQARRIALVTMLLSPVLRYVALRAGVNGSSVYHFTPFRLDGLATGAFIALSMRDPVARAGLDRLSKIAGLAALAVAAVLYGPVPIPEPFSTQLDFSVGFSALCIGFGALLTRVVSEADSSLTRVLSRRGLVTLGTYSYAMYLLHVPLLRVLSKLGLPPQWPGSQRWPMLWLVGYTIVLGLLTLAGAIVSWHLCEKHFLALKRNFPYGVRERLAPCDRAA
ncbi:MAG: acyltransferase family protein [Gemmatimonadaceae bacterium]